MTKETLNFTHLAGDSCELPVSELVHPSKSTKPSGDGEANPHRRSGAEMAKQIEIEIDETKIQSRRPDLLPDPVYY